MRGEQGLYADLAALSIAHEVHEHSAVFTVEESRAIKAAIPGAHTKNLFLKDAGGAFRLVTVRAEIRVDLKGLPALLTSKRFSFGKAEAMERLIGVTPGSVTPLAMINAEPGSVHFALDAALAEAERINVHPLRNTATLGLAPGDLMRLMGEWGHEVTVINTPTT
ncbi:prolyl-tRNA synthetase associated domain-containing protein [Erythrobacter litoralis]|uniref:DNA-binding protein, putative n=1 Tax=Erythrobacter litoralis (strain HTCC2594) TaxID=314225 RepID=Q2N7H0_ERYLH|nr:prolyl-tRNA synthetase associated domain-containing protein [Erythrobacter litoralis]ABC64371.1 DNA-binding protein, putative [Erythrobacter litoralis HTCC2594]